MQVLEMRVNETMPASGDLLLSVEDRSSFFEITGVNVYHRLLGARQRRPAWQESGAQARPGLGEAEGAPGRGLNHGSTSSST